MADAQLSERVKAKAREEGADLVGIAPVERFQNAPLMMSPQGHMPEAKCVVVFAVHHLDAAIELGGEPTAHDFGPYATQSSTMNPRLDSIAFRLARLLEEASRAALPMPVTNIWRYRPYKSIGQSFAPDLVHRYAAVAAGLGEIGWNGLFLSPEFGPRQRISAVITNAELDPSPMYEGPSLCDRCMLCVKVCPTQALSKNFNKMNRLEIGGRVFEFPDTNKWRCAWAENFGLDLRQRLPETVDENLIIEVTERDGRFGGAMGQCLRVCLPPHLRVKNPDYTRVWRRKREFVHLSGREMTAVVKEIGVTGGADWIVTRSAEELKDAGVEMKEVMPDAETAVILGMRDPGGALSRAVRYRLNSIRYDIARYLERQGYSATGGFAHKHRLTKNYKALPDYLLPVSIGLAEYAGEGIFSKEFSNKGFVDFARLQQYDSAVVTPQFGEKQQFLYLLTAARLDRLETVPSTAEPRPAPSSGLTAEVKSIARAKGIDLAGVSSVARLESLLPQLREIFAGKEFLVVESETGPRHGRYKPVGRVEKIEVKAPTDWLDNAQSVLVLGLHYPDACMDRAAMPPAESVGPYAAHGQFQVTEELLGVALEIERALTTKGYRSVAVLDLCGTASRLYNPRCGYDLHDATANRFAALAAGLGEIGRHGVLLTPRYGVRQRFVAIVTDAPLHEDPVYAGGPLCEKCGDCVSACPVGALAKDKSHRITVGGRSFTWARLDRPRCDWAKRYGLVGDEGPRYMGSQTDIMPPQEVMLEALCAACRKLDPIQRYHFCILERCLKACRYDRSLRAS